MAVTPTIHEVMAAFRDVRRSPAVPDGERATVLASSGLAYFCGLTPRQLLNARRRALDVAIRQIEVPGPLRRRPIVYRIPEALMPDLCDALPSRSHRRSQFVLPVGDLARPARLFASASGWPVADLWGSLRRAAITHCCAANGIGAAFEFSGLLSDQALRLIDWSQVPVGNRGAVIDCESLLLAPRVRVQYAEQVDA